MGNTHVQQVFSVVKSVVEVATKVSQAIEYLAPLVLGAEDGAVVPHAQLRNDIKSEQDVNRLRDLLQQLIEKNWKSRFGYTNQYFKGITPTPKGLKMGANVFVFPDIVCATEDVINQSFLDDWKQGLQRLFFDTSSLDGIFMEVWGGIKQQSFNEAAQFAITSHTYPLTSNLHKNKMYSLDIAGAGTMIKGDTTIFVFGFEAVIYEMYDPTLMKNHK